MGTGYTPSVSPAHDLARRDADDDGVTRIEGGHALVLGILPVEQAPRALEHRARREDVGAAGHRHTPEPLPAIDVMIGDEADARPPPDVGHLASRLPGADV